MNLPQKILFLLRKIKRFIYTSWETWKKIHDELQEEENYKSMLLSRNNKIQTYINSHQVKKLHIGAGTNFLPGWLNSDLNPGDERILYLDATEPFPFQEHSFDYVFSEHMIEHLTYKDALYMLSEIYRILKPRGKVRISTPDALKTLDLLNPEKSDEQKRYLEWSAVEMMGLYNPEKSKYQIHRPEWDIDPAHFHRFFPDQKSDPACFVVNSLFRSYGHKFLFDSVTLAKALESSGFIQIKEYSPGVSADDSLMRIEQHANVIGGAENLYESLVMEATHG